MRYPFLLHVISEQKVVVPLYKSQRMTSFVFQIIQVKSLIGSVLGDSQNDAVSSRLVLERPNNMSDAHLWLLDTPGANFSDQLKGLYCEIPRVSV